MRCQIRNSGLESMKKNQNSQKRGRPPLPSHQARSNRVVTFLTDEELKRLQEISSNVNDSLSSTCHRIIGEYLKKPSLL
jgi:hypothetical protein